MNRKLTRKEFEEIAVLSRKCINAYSTKEGKPLENESVG